MVHFYILNIRPENWKSCKDGMIYGFADGAKSWYPFAPGDAFFIRVTGEGYGVNGIWLFSYSEPVTPKTQVPWRDATYKEILHFTPIVTSFNKPFSEEFEGNRKFSRKLGISAIKLAVSILRLSSRESRRYVERIFQEKEQEMQERISYRGEELQTGKVLQLLIQKLEGETSRIEAVDFPLFLESVDLKAGTPQLHSLRNPARIRIQDIISRCANLEWILPNFQRYFDWKRNDVTSFLESVFKDYYVGSFLLWEIGPSFGDLGTIAIMGVDKRTDRQRSLEIILDGQQRITSLYYAIHSPNFSLRGSNSPTYFYVNFQSVVVNDESEETVVALETKISREESFQRMLFPFFELPTHADWVDGLEDFMIKVAPGNDDKIRRVRRIIERKLRHMWDGYEIPYISLPKTITLSQVADIFERINTRGKKLTVFDLLIARLSKYDKNLRELWEQSRNRYPKLINYSKRIEKIPTYILQSIALSYTRTSSCKREDLLNVYESVQGRTGLSFEEIWADLSGYFNKAIARLENLRGDGFGVKDEKVIPFAPMIPILASLLKLIELSENKSGCYAKLNQWYWASVFSNAYSSSADSQLTADYKEMRDWFTDGNRVPRTVELARRSVPTLNLTEIESQSNAMYRGVLSIIALEGAKDFETMQDVEHAASNDRDHIFPRSEFQHEEHVNSVVNITWMSGDTNRRIKRAKRPSVYLKEFIEERHSKNEGKFLQVLESHLIDKVTYEHMINNDLQGMMVEREKRMITKIGELLGISIPPPKPELISPDRPFSNRLLLVRTIRYCDTYLWWVDKYFPIEGLEILLQSLPETNVKSLKILLSIDNASIELRSSFKNFKEEIKGKGIDCEMRVIIDRKVRSNIHDRWIVSKTKTFNLPSVDTIKRGQYSEITPTTNSPPFQDWWKESEDIMTAWNKINEERQKKGYA